VRIAGLANFTDPSNAPVAPGESLPTGWTADTPNVGDFGYAANGRTARLGPAGDPTDPDSGLALNMVCLVGTTIDLFGGPGAAQLTLSADSGGQITVETLTGVIATPEAGATCFTANGSQGAIVALDAGGLHVIGFQGLPTSDPHSAGALYTTAGALMVSAG
jgi:hypothetical protein